jgi:glyoxylase-like metal-dependent hydrolase (beta-lactamase superfamily II)
LFRSFLFGKISLVPTASDLTSVSPSLVVWQAYDSAVKADLFSTAIVTSGGVYVVDPIPVEPELLEELLNLGPIRGLMLTNENHWRGVREFAARFSAPIFAAAGAVPANCDVDVREVENGTRIDGGLFAVAIEGAARGEIAIFHDADGGTLAIGDALINFEPYGFTFLPPKYCVNQREMRRSLRRLLDFKIERIVFAHGAPITARAGARLRRLLDADAD